MANDFLTEVTFKDSEMTVSMTCDMSVTDNAVDYVFRLLVLSGHDASNVSKAMIDRGEEHLKMNEN